MAYAKKLSGTIAIVTGGAGILGAEFCKVLALNGASVAVLDVNKESATQLSKELQSQYPDGNFLGIGCDLKSEVEIEKAVKRVTDEMGRVDILVNNAASKTANLANFFQPFEDYSLDTWKDVMSVNVDAMFLTARAVGKRMKADGKGGKIVQIASVYGCVGPDASIYKGSKYLGVEINTPAVYSASKAAVLGLTKYLATYWGSSGIRVNSISPGGVASGQNDEFVNRYSAKVPMARMGERTEIAATLLFLVSEDSSYITGQNIIVDGGFTAW